MVFDEEKGLRYNSRRIASSYICVLGQLRFSVFTDGVDMLTNATVADLLRPCEKRRAIFYDIALIISGSLLIGLCAQVAILLPFSPVHVTGQTFAVLMIGALLGARRGCFAVLAYIIEGAGGLPVFAL